MRILSIGNLYPPHHRGGYELRWYGDTQRLRGLGHDVLVLTTDHEERGVRNQPIEDVGVRRQLRAYRDANLVPLRTSLNERLRIERHNHGVVHNLLSTFEPQLVVWWNMAGLSLTLIEAVRRVGIPAVGVVGDTWMFDAVRLDNWLRPFSRTPTRLARIVERRVGVPTVIDLGASATWIFNSDYLLQKSVQHAGPLPRTEVVRLGPDPVFRPKPERQVGIWRGELLYSGRVNARKGVDVAVSALPHVPGTRLLVAGSYEGEENYVEQIRAAASTAGTADRLRFAGRRDKAQVAAACRAADAVVFPVRWEEPFGRVPLEAMASGTPVIATASGGAREYLVDGTNCLLVPRDDPLALARAIQRLAADVDLRVALHRGGLSTVASLNYETYFSAMTATYVRCASRVAQSGATGAVDLAGLE